MTNFQRVNKLINCMVCYTHTQRHARQTRLLTALQIEQMQIATPIGLKKQYV